MDRKTGCTVVMCQSQHPISTFSVVTGTQQHRHRPSTVTTQQSQHRQRGQKPGR